MPRGGVSRHGAPTCGVSRWRSSRCGAGMEMTLFGMAKSMRFVSLPGSASLGEPQSPSVSVCPSVK